MLHPANSVNLTVKAGRQLRRIMQHFFVEKRMKEDTEPKKSIDQDDMYLKFTLKINLKWNHTICILGPTSGGASIQCCIRIHEFSANIMKSLHICTNKKLASSKLVTKKYKKLRLKA
jgi:hypothetical protein